MLQVLDLRQVVDDDIGIGRMRRLKVLMIGLGRIELPRRLDLGDNSRIEDLCTIELFDIGLGDISLRLTGREDRRTVLRPGIRPLIVQLRRIMRHREIDLQ